MQTVPQHSFLQLLETKSHWLPFGPSLLQFCRHSTPLPLPTSADHPYNSRAMNKDDTYLTYPSKLRAGFHAPDKPPTKAIAAVLALPKNPSGELLLLL